MTRPLTIISNFYNEELLAPFFMEHYKNEADRFIIFIDQDTTDRTEEIVLSYPNVETRPLVFPDKMHEYMRNDYIRGAYNELKEGWAVIVDADEFVFQKNSSIKEVITKSEPLGYNVIRSFMWTPFRHHDDKDLDSSLLPIVNQRRHGVIRFYEEQYHKPIIVKSGLNLTWHVGHHTIATGTYYLAPYSLQGVHWCFADPSIIEKRLLKKWERMSQFNKDHKFGFELEQYTNETTAELIKEHLNDPILF